MRYFLVGFMGIGKSTLGKGLAHRLAVPFLDTDAEIERLAGRTIAEIFSEEGEQYFRMEERRVLQILAIRHMDGVFATGGGLPCHMDNLQMLKALGTVIYLHANDVAITNRLLNSKGKRPLLADKSPAELQLFVTALLAERDPIYRQSDIVVDLDLAEHAGPNIDYIFAKISQSAGD